MDPIKFWQTLVDYAIKANDYVVFSERDRRRYCRFGLLSEVGEIAALFKREIRDGTPIKLEELIDEIGDVFWYFCMECYDSERRTLVMPSHIVRFGHSISSLAIMTDLINLLDAFDIRLEDALNANLDKLARRKANNTIHGKGDR